MDIEDTHTVDQLHKKTRETSSSSSLLSSTTAAFTVEADNLSQFGKPLAKTSSPAMTALFAAATVSVLIILTNAHAAAVAAETTFTFAGLFTQTRW